MQHVVQSNRQTPLVAFAIYALTSYATYHYETSDTINLLIKKQQMRNNNKKATLLATLHQSYATSPDLHVAHGSTKLIFGHGNPAAQMVLIGEAPGAEEDRLGEPFVGRSGKLLTALLESIGIARNDIYITNAVKVRPPNNRKPTTQEIDRSRTLLMQQLDIIKPRIVCTLGATALQAVTGTQQPITQMRGKMLQIGEIMALPTYHPAYILRNPKELQTLYNDLALAHAYAKKQI